MKIVVLKCSPRKRGNSNLLADSFIKGATEAGHEVAESAKMMYEKMVAYLGWEDCGRLIVPGVWAAGDIRNTDNLQKAYESELHI